jgi:hypothetical protein
MPRHEYVCISPDRRDASALAFAVFGAASVANINYDKGLAAALVSSRQNPSTARGGIMFAVQHGIGRTSLQDADHRRPCMGRCVVYRNQDSPE